MKVNNNTQVLRKNFTFHISNLGLTGSQEPVRIFNIKMKGGTLE